MRYGSYRAGRQAETFLRRWLEQGPVAVSQLEAAAGQERISRATLYRTAKRLGVERTVTEGGKLWALPESAPQQATGQREEPVRDRTPGGNSPPVQNRTPEKESGVVAAVAQSEGRAVALAPVPSGTPETVIVAETDPRLEEFVADIRRLMSRGQRPGPIIHRIRKQLGPELADQVKAVLDADAEK